MIDVTPNIPEVVAEVRDIFERYEQALIDKNCARLHHERRAAVVSRRAMAPARDRRRLPPQSRLARRCKVALPGAGRECRKREDFRAARTLLSVPSGESE